MTLDCRPKPLSYYNRRQGIKDGKMAKWHGCWSKDQLTEEADVACVSALQKECEASVNLDYMT